MVEDFLKKSLKLSIHDYMNDIPTVVILVGKVVVVLVGKVELYRVIITPPKNRIRYR